MARNRRARRSNGSSRRGGRVLGASGSNTPMTTLALTPSEVFERTLGRTNDSCVLRGKLIINPTLNSTPAQISYLIPNFFGARATAFGNVFSRFRIKALNIRFLPAGNASTGSLATAVGILDDPSSTTSPATGSDVLELRSSALALAGQTVPSNILYTPLDKTKWYYTIGVTGSDNRLTVPGFLYGYVNTPGSSSGLPVGMEIDFSLVFAGATDNGTT